MALSQSLSGSLFALVATLAMALPVVGCAPEVTTEGGRDGGDGGGGAGGGGGGGGAGGVDDPGGEGCLAYEGAGCTPGEIYDCGYSDITMSNLSMQCYAVEGEVCTTEWDEGCNTPLVLSFDGAAVEYLSDREHGFDVNGMRSLVTDWPTAKTPWLALDRNGNGSIDDGAELFGSMSILRGGARAENGFVALRELDANGDGHITAEDPGFARLLVWGDENGDRRSGGAELASAAARELLSIDLGYAVEPRCDSRGNCEVERASFHYRDTAGVERTGAVIDIHLAVQR